MRLWHEALISMLPRQQLLGQHRECCALRGAGWMRPHATVNYVFTHPFEYLVQYHLLVIEEMTRRGYRVSPEWLLEGYRGKQRDKVDINPALFTNVHPIYPEHDERYLRECVENLQQKRIIIPQVSLL